MGYVYHFCARNDIEGTAADGILVSPEKIVRHGQYVAIRAAIFETVFPGITEKAKQTCSIISLTYFHEHEGNINGDI